MSDLAEEIVKGVGARLFTKLPRCAIGDNFPLIDDDCAGASGINFFKNMSGKKDGLGFTQSGNKLPDLMFLIGVKSVGWFIENQDGGVVDKCLCQTGAVSVAFGQSVDRLMGDGFQKTSFNDSGYGFFFYPCR